MGTIVTADSLLDRLRQMSWPQPPLDTPEVHPGQVWRAAWEDVVCLVMVLSIPEGRWVRAAAATGEPIGDDRTVSAATDSGLAMNVWSDVASMLPLFVLEQRVGDVSDEVLASVLAAQDQPPLTWPPITSIHDDRALFRASLLDAVETLASLDWAEVRPSGDANLRDLAAERGLKASDLARILGTTPGEGRRLLDGKRNLTVSEAQEFAMEFGQPVQTVVSFDEGLLTELDQPALRPLLHQRAVDRFAGDEVAARRDVAEFTGALAARHREAGERNWRELLQEYLGED